MENFINSLNMNKIKQPKPDISTPNKEAKRAIQKPYIGIISNINPTSTPLTDTVSLKEQEIPREKRKPIKIKNSAFNFDNVATGGIITCGILAIISLLKKIKK